MDNLRLTTENIYPHLLQAIEESSSIYFLTSFIQKSGAALLADPLRKAAARGADIKICTGDYLYITSPDALELLSSIDGVDLRLYRSGNRGFHPKAYLFRKEDEGLMIIGSANLSESALKSGVEWNLSVNKDVDPLVFEQALEEYMKVFHHEKPWKSTRKRSRDTVGTMRSIIGHTRRCRRRNRNFPHQMGDWWKL